jgi:hypothetical protein
MSLMLYIQATEKLSDFSKYLRLVSIINLANERLCLGHSMSGEPNFQHSDPRMKLPICEAKIMNSFGDFFKSLKR